MATQLLVAQKKSMQQFIAKDKAAFILNLSPYKTYNKLDTATTNKYNISEMLAPMLLKMAGGDASESNLQQIQEDLEDTQKIGLNIQKDVYIWAQRPENPTDEIYENDPNVLFANIVVPITDGAKFRTFLDNLFGKEKTKVMIPTGNALSMLHNKLLLNWSKERLIIAFSTSEQSFFEETEEYEARTKRMLLEHAKALGSLEASNSIAQDSDYQKHLNKDADFDVWMDYANIMPPLDQLPMQARDLMGSLFEFVGGMKLGGNGFIKNGEAEFLTKVYANEAMARVLSKSYNVKVNKDFFKYLDNSNLMGMYSFAMNPKGFMDAYSSELYTILKESREGTLITNLLDIIDIFIDEDEIYTLFKGDLLLALTDVKVIDRKSSDFEYNEETDKWEEITTTEKDVIPMATMMLSYGNKENIMKFIDLGANAGLLSKRADGVWAIGGVKEELGFDVFVVVHNGILMFTNDENITKNLNGIAKNKQLSGKTVKEITSYVQYGFMDADKMVQTAKKTFEQMDQKVPRELAHIEKTFKRLEFKTFAPQGNEMKSDFRLQLKDPNANVLQTMVDGILKIAKQEMGRKHQMEDQEIEEEEEGTKKL
ncbi:DUF4836 family protein [Aureispira anguillae]|nr:DUF4836 family protein [Aureispira anguillae]